MSSIGYDFEPSAQQQSFEDWAVFEHAREHEAAVQTCLVHGLDLRGVAHRDLGDRAFDIADGEPWCSTELAGLQFYDYGVWDAFLEQRVMPGDGDRLSLVRAPDNPHDPNAVEVWWRNGLRLGHLPRAVAAVVAGPLDRGEPCAAYVADGGTGEAWTAKAVLIGEAVRDLHEKRIAHVIETALTEARARDRRAEWERQCVGLDTGRAFEAELADRRRARLVQAVNALLPGQPFEIEPPAVGTYIELFAIEKLLDVSRSTARRIAERAGARIEINRRGWYAASSHVVVTERLRQALIDWAAHPIRRITHEDVRLGPDSIVAPPPERDDPDDIPF